MSEKEDTSRVKMVRSSYKEFQDCLRHIAYMKNCGSHEAGPAKIIPSAKWIPRKSGYDMKEVERITPTSIVPVVSGNQSCYQQFNILKQQMSLKDFKDLAESERYCMPRHYDYDEFERKYWESVGYITPIYDADIRGALNDSNLDEWNTFKCLL